jgi:hypothetical protein
MRYNKKSFSWPEEQARRDKELSLIKKSELKLKELGFELVTRNTYWLVYENSGKRHIFEDANSLYKFCYRKKYLQEKKVRDPEFVPKPTASS